MEFTYEAYSRLIHMIKDNSFSISNYHNFDSYEKSVILRHDVDMSIEKALEMAKLENELNIKSTYFFLLSTDFYNIASKSSTSQVHQIWELGHEIGLHFDEVKYYDKERKGIHSYVQDELRAMEMILQIPIKVVSMHRPSKLTLYAEYNFGDIVNSYSKTFFKEFKYVSDSRRHWREDIFEIIQNNQHKKVHILTHPFWYYNKERSIKESILQFVNNANWERYLAVKDNVRDCDEIMGPSEVYR